MSTAYDPDSNDDNAATAAGGQGSRPDDPLAPYGGRPPAGETAAPYPAQPWHAGMPPPPPPPPPAGWHGYSGPAWHGYGGPAWPGGPGYAWTGAPDSQQQRRRHRRRRRAAIAAGVAAAAIAAGGTAWATTGTTTLSTAQIVSQTDPGLVDVISTLGYQHGTAEGTGMVLTSNGEVLTNNHVVDGATSIQVRDVGNDRTYAAKVVGYSDKNDVAVLQLTGASGLTTVKTGNSGSVKVGQTVVAIGNAEGKDGTPSVATGTVTGLGATITASDSASGTSEQLTDMIQTNAGIEPGDSGGPLVDSSGVVVGMNTAASAAGAQVGTTADTTTQAFSIPIDKALSIADQIEAGQSSATVHIGATAFLGVEVSSASSGGFSGGLGQTSGVTIEGAVSGTAAAAAGLTDGDTITSVGGHAVSSGSDLQSVIEGYHPGDKVTVVWQDQFGQTHSSVLTLTQGPTG
jgi:S1-C subfamily serine protease